MRRPPAHSSSRLSFPGLLAAGLLASGCAGSAIQGGAIQGGAIQGGAIQAAPAVAQASPARFASDAARHAPDERGDRSATPASTEEHTAADQAVRETPPEEVDDVAVTLETQPARCPDEMALVDDRVCVDRWESTIVQVLESGEEQPWSPFHPINGAQGRLRAVSQPGVVPQGYISGEQAERACMEAGKRLCTADEWVAACRGPARTRYPYGEQRREGTCNDAGRATHPVAEVTRRFGLPEHRMWYEGMDHPQINQLHQTLDRTGERASCTNDYGVFDMVGNLHEWIEDPEGTFRGGFYMDTIRNGEGCDYATTAHSKKYHDYSTGFRCCLDADSVE